MAAYSQAELDALRKAYASGALQVRYGDKMITYANRQDLKARIDELEADITGRRAVRQVRTYTTKGF